jgi:hypothetical protein
MGVRERIQIALSVWVASLGCVLCLLGHVWAAGGRLGRPIRNALRQWIIYSNIARTPHFSTRASPAGLRKWSTRVRTSPCGQKDRLRAPVVRPIRINCPRAMHPGRKFGAVLRRADTRRQGRASVRVDAWQPYKPYN